MSINFLVRKNRQKKPRIEVVRWVKEEGKRGSIKSLGNLPANLDDAYKAFVDELDNDELFQLINKVGNLQFNQEHFDAPPDRDDFRVIIELHLPFYKALNKLILLARDHDVDFNPAKVMLTALLNKAQRTEQELSEKLGKPVKIMEELELKRTPRYNKKEMKERFHHGGQELFKALIELKKPLGEVCDQFRLIAEQRYGKSARINVKVLEGYAEKPARYSLWYCTVAIDTLLHYGKNPLSVLPSKKIIEHWARPRVQQMGLDQLKKEFFKQFEVDKPAQAKLSISFDEIYHSLTSSETNED